MPQSESIQHPASLSCRGQTAASAPLPHCPLQSKAAGTAQGFRGISRIKGISLRNWKGQSFGFWLCLKTKKYKVPDVTRLICLFPPGFYKSGRTDFSRACIRGWIFHFGGYQENVRHFQLIFLGQSNIFNTNKLQTHRFHMDFLHSPDATNIQRVTPWMVLPIHIRHHNACF